MAVDYGGEYVVSQPRSNERARRPQDAGRSVQLDGASLDLLTMGLLTAGFLASLLFTIVYLIEGATRPGYSALVLPISALSLGLQGWIQQLNFGLFGIVTVVTAIGWRRALAGGFGSSSYPIFRIVEGFGLVVAGTFSQDPMAGYNPDHLTLSPSLHGEIHLLSSYVSFASLAAIVILALRFRKEPTWRRWTWPTIVFAFLPIVFIAAFGATYGHVPSGVFERLASSAGLPLGAAIIARLWAQRSRRAPARQTEALAALPR